MFDKPDFEGAAYVMSPPIRPAGRGHQDALWNALAAALLQTGRHRPLPVHAGGPEDAGRDAFTKIPNGAAGVEDRLSLMYTFGVARRPHRPCTIRGRLLHPAGAIFGLYPRKGAIAVGSDADLVVYDPTGTRTLSRQDPPPGGGPQHLRGMQVKGRIAATVAAGAGAVHGRRSARRARRRALPRARAPRPSPGSLPTHAIEMGRIG